MTAFWYKKTGKVGKKTTGSSFGFFSSRKLKKISPPSLQVAEPEHSKSKTHILPCRQKSNKKVVDN